MRFVREHDGIATSLDIQSGTINGDLVVATSPIRERFARTEIQTAGNVTYTAAQLATTIMRDPAGANRTDVMPAATAIIAELGLAVGDTNVLTIVNFTDAGSPETLTISGGTGNVYLGPAVISTAGAARWLVTAESSTTVSFLRMV